MVTQIEYRSWLMDKWPYALWVIAAMQLLQVWLLW